MIKLDKGPKPEVLEKNEKTWKNEYRKLLGGDRTVPAAAKTRYRHPQIKAAVKTEAYEKCIYCESKISHVHPGETDHIIPRSKAPELVVDWNNLGYVCRECNVSKLDYHDVKTPLLNPFLDDPKDHLVFLGPMVIAKRDNLRAQITVDKIKLSRPALIERKAERINFVKALLDRSTSLPEGEGARAALEEIAKEEANPEKEYSATVKAFLSTMEE